MSTDADPTDSDAADAAPTDNGQATESGTRADVERERVRNTRAMASEARSSMGARFSGAGIPAEKSKNFRTSARRLVSWLHPERFGTGAVVILATGSVALSVIGPRRLGRATDIVVNGVSSGDGVDLGDLHRTLLGVVAIYAASAFLMWATAYVLTGVVQRTMNRLRSAVEDKLHRLPLAHIDSQPRGDLLSRVTNDIDNISQSLQQTMSQLLTSTLTIIGVAIMMVAVSPPLALVALLSIPLSFGLIGFIAARSKGRFIAQWRYTGVLNGQVEEAFTGHALVKLFGRQAEVERDFGETNQKLYEASFGAQFISGSIQPAMTFVGNLNYVAIAVLGGVRVASGAMSLGDVQAFIQYSRQFTQPLTQVASMVNVFQSGVASAERVFEFLDTEEESPEPEPRPGRDAESDADVALLAAAGAAGTQRGRVDFDHVSFSYDPESPLIEDLSLVAEPGRTVAIVGPTGAGKTTLVNLIMRFYELDGGAIRLDGRDISTMSRQDLRSNVGMVLQDTWLFGGTIRDNIAYGNLDAGEEQILDAARATYVDRFVHSLSDGYDTLIDEEGTSMSAGEKQLLTIARAFLADPAILILDEATSSVDTRTEVLIQKAMSALRASRTSFVIAHRLSTIRDADIILVMEDGDIVEQGTHDELLAAHGAYHRLYTSQFASAVVEV